MAVILDTETSATPANPAAGGESAGTTQEELSINQEIAAHNARIADGEQEPAGPSPAGEPDEQAVETGTPEATDDPSKTGVPSEEAERTDAINDEETGDSDAAAGEASPADGDVIEFDVAAETAETFVAKRTAVLERYELPQDVQNLLAYQDARYQQLEGELSGLDVLGNREQIGRIAKSFDALYDTEVVEGTALKANVTPIVDLFRTDYKKEVVPVAEALFAVDSPNIQGATVFEEVLLNQFDAEKVKAAVAYLSGQAPLPVVPPDLALPSVVSESSREAYFRMSEPKRFAVQELVNEIATLERDLASGELDEADLPDARTKLAEAKTRLNDEVQLIDSYQARLNSDRQGAEIAARQRYENAAAFRETVNESYLAEQLRISDTFAKDLAPRLTFADGDTQLSQARNIMARVQNALSFYIGPDGSFKTDPNAGRVAKELKEEGLKYDFDKGRQILQKLYSATNKLEVLKAGKNSPQAIEKAQRELAAVRLEVNAETRAAMAELSGRYVQSNGTALKKKVDEISGKKQIARKTIDTSGKSAPMKKREDSAKQVDDDIKAFNQKVASRPEDVYEYYNQG